MSLFPAYGTGTDRLPHPRHMVPEPLPQSVHDAAQLVEEAERNVKAALGRHSGEIKELDDRRRAARALLAAEIRETAKAHYPRGVEDLCDVVGPLMDIRPKTVSNALYETFRLDVFEQALAVLAKRVTARPLAA